MHRFSTVLRVLTLCACCLLAACSGGEGQFRKFATPRADGFARTYIQRALAHDSAGIAAVLSPTLMQQPFVVDSVISTMRYVGPGQVNRVRLVAANSTYGDGKVGRLIGYELRTDRGSYSLVHVWVLEDPSHRLTIEGARVNSLPASLDELNRFTLSGKGAAQGIVLLMAIASPLFCLYAIVQVLRTPMRRRWAWVLLAMLAAGGVTIQWGTGEMMWSLIHVQLLGAGYVGAGAGMALTASFPVGAVMALQKRRRVLDALARGSAQPREAEAPQDPE